MYVPLRVHGWHSLLTGVDPPAALLERAAELGLPALALCDVDTLSGSFEFLRAARTGRGGPSPPGGRDQRPRRASGTARGPGAERGGLPQPVQAGVGAAAGRRSGHRRRAPRRPAGLRPGRGGGAAPDGAPVPGRPPAAGLRPGRAPAGREPGGGDLARRGGQARLPDEARAGHRGGGARGDAPGSQGAAPAAGGPGDRAGRDGARARARHRRRPRRVLGAIRRATPTTRCARRSSTTPCAATWRPPGWPSDRGTCRAWRS